MAIKEQTKNEIEAAKRAKAIHSLNPLVSFSNRDIEAKNHASFSQGLSSDGKISLLSEGFILYSTNMIRAYIMKGAIQEYVDSLDDSFQGVITMGHITRENNPSRLGTFSKQDLSVELDSTGRATLYVRPTIRKDLSVMKDQEAVGNRLSVSVEFSGTVYNALLGEDEVEELQNVTELVEGDPQIYYPVFKELHIDAYALVGAPGNALCGYYNISEVTH